MEQWLHQEPHFHQALVLYFCATINPDLVSMVVCRCNRMQPTREFNQENECDQNQSMGDTQHFFFFVFSGRRNQWTEVQWDPVLGSQTSWYWNSSGVQNVFTHLSDFQYSTSIHHSMQRIKKIWQHWATHFLIYEHFYSNVAFFF